MKFGTDILVVAAGYGLGCVCFGYYFVKLCAREDIRDFGSGNVGAKNVGRRLGALAFLVALVGDMVKGAAAVGIAIALDCGPWTVGLTMLAAVCGHIWPVQMGFRGGKGIATFIGGLALVDYWALIGLIVVFGVVFVVSRRFTFSGLIGFAAGPFVVLWTGGGRGTGMAIAVSAALVLIAHAGNIRDIRRAMRAEVLPAEPGESGPEGTSDRTAEGTEE